MSQSALVAATVSRICVIDDMESGMFNKADEVFGSVHLFCLDSIFKGRYPIIVVGFNGVNSCYWFLLGKFRG